MFFGGLIYIIFRSSDLLMFKWISFFHLNQIVFFFRSFIFWKNIFPKWVIYSLPDGLWMFSGTSLILNVWGNSINKQSIFWILMIPFIAILFEFLQLIHLMRGTFDIIDIVIYLIGFGVSILIFSSKKKYLI